MESKGVYYCFIGEELVLEWSQEVSSLGSEETTGVLGYKDSKLVKGRPEAEEFKQVLG